MQALESAGRRRATEPSTPIVLPETAAESQMSKPTGRRRAKSVDAGQPKPTNRSTTIETVSFSSSYASPTEASYASLTRCLAQAAAAVTHASMPKEIIRPQPIIHSFPLPPNTLYMNDLDQLSWQPPVSAFSDWGSSRNSIAAYTPTPGGQLEDPFEYDAPSAAQSSQFSEPSPFDPNQRFEADDFDMFAAAIERNQNSRPFVIPAFSTSGLMKRRLMSPLCAEPQNTSALPSPPIDEDRRESACSEATQTPSMFGTASQREADQPPLIAARRNLAGPTVLGMSTALRSKSFNDALPQVDCEHMQPARRESAFDGNRDKRSKFDANISLDHTYTQFNLNIFDNIPATNSAICLSKQSSDPAFGHGPFARHAPDQHFPFGTVDESMSPPVTPPNMSCDESSLNNVPELGFTDSATPESATFASALDSLSDAYGLHFPAHPLFHHAGYQHCFDVNSECSSGSSGILLGKETTAFPFEEFLNARFSDKVQVLS